MFPLMLVDGQPTGSFDFTGNLDITGDVDVTGDIVSDSISTTGPNSLPNTFTSLHTATTITSTGNQAAVDVTGVNRLICNNASLLTIQGLLGGIEGQELLIESIGAGQIDLVHLSGSAASGNKLTNVVTSGPTPLAAAKGRANYVYRGSTWELVDHTQGDWIANPFTAGDYTASGSMTFTVASGDVPVNQYYILGKVLHWNFRVITATVGGTPSTQLIVKLPSTYTIAVGFDHSNRGADNGTEVPIYLAFNASNQINIQKIPTANWAASTNLTQVAGMLNIDLA